ncbi:MAG: PhoH family protein [Rhizobiaceae bacterium]
MSSVENLPAFVTAPSRAKGAKNGSADLAQAVVVFDDNHFVKALFGQYDEHLAVLERELHVDAASRGNEVHLSGSREAIEQTRTVLDALYKRILAGEDVQVGDVEGAVTQVSTAKAKTKLAPKVSASKSAGLPTSSISTAKKTIHARTPTQDAYIRAMDKAEMIFGTGPAGTGKTYLAVAYAASLLERGAVDRIILSRPAVEAGERLGFLPGDMKEKVDPYLRPLYDALYDMMAPDKVERAISSELIEIAPLAFMRGRTLAHAAVILDEAQNTTTMQMKMFLTRLGQGSKMIITGDPSQIDLPNGQKSGLVQALEILPQVKGIESVEFTAADVVRHKLVGRIVEAYDEALEDDLRSR